MSSAMLSVLRNLKMPPFMVYELPDEKSTSPIVTSPPFCVNESPPVPPSVNRRAELEKRLPSSTRIAWDWRYDV